MPDTNNTTLSLYLVTQYQTKAHVAAVCVTARTYNKTARVTVAWPAVGRYEYHEHMLQRLFGAARDNIRELMSELGNPRITDVKLKFPCLTMQDTWLMDRYVDTHPEIYEVPTGHLLDGEKNRPVIVCASEKDTFVAQAMSTARKASEGPFPNGSVTRLWTEPRKTPAKPPKPSYRYILHGYVTPADPVSKFGLLSNGSKLLAKATEAIRFQVPDGMEFDRIGNGTTRTDWTQSLRDLGAEPVIRVGRQWVTDSDLKALWDEHVPCEWLEHLRSIGYAAAYGKPGYVKLSP